MVGNGVNLEDCLEREMAGDGKYEMSYEVREPNPNEELLMFSDCFPAKRSERFRLLRKHHSPLRFPQPLAKALQHDQNDDRGARDPSLRAKCRSRACLSDPLNLDERRHEARPVSTRGHPGTDLSRSLWIGVEQVAVDRSRHDHHTNRLQRREDRKHHVMPLPLEREADDDDRDEQERSRWICDE